MRAEHLNMKRKLEPFTCTKCGETVILPFSKARKYCPKCVVKVRNEQSLEAYYEKKRREASIEVEEPKVEEITEDETFDARINAQIKKQCRHCRYWDKPHNTGGAAHCSYYLRYGIGHRVDPGNGPGDCRSFEPKREITKQERVQRSLDALKQSEADAAIRKGTVE